MLHRLKLGIGALAIGALAVPVGLSLTPGNAHGAPFPGTFPDDETTVSVFPSGDSKATVVRLPDLKVGETRTLTAENGKPVTVTRDEDGYKINVNGRAFQINMLDGAGQIFLSRDGEGAHSFVSGDGNVKKVVVMKKGNGFAFHSGDGSAASIGEVLEKQDLKALRGADRRTRDTVLEALRELAESGTVLVPGAASPMLIDADGKGDKVMIKVIRKKSDDK